MNVFQADPGARADDVPAARSGGLVATGSVLGALLASACCVLPLVLVTLGVSGAWLSTMTALEPYSIYFGAATVVLIGAGFRQVYWRRATACDPGSYCATPVATRVAKTALWSATLLVVATFTLGLWAPLFY